MDYREQYEQILHDMRSVGVNHGDIYKSCQSYKTAFCKREEWYELMVKNMENPRISLVDFGWATVDGSFSCAPHADGKIDIDEIGYKPQDDASVLEKLDQTFHRSLRVEQHFLVDWTKYFSESQVREEIKRWKNLRIRKVEEHPMYLDSERIKVFSAFYNMKVDDFRGRSPFNMYFIDDMNPTYDLRPSSKGNRLVNAAMFDLKASLRQKMSGGFKIHATDNIQETKDNMRVLNLNHEYRYRNFDTLERVFDVLNFSGAMYVVLRNFEKMPDEVVVDPNHLDVDLLVYDYYDVKRILDGDSPQNLWSVSYEVGKYRIVNTVLIGGKRVNFDVRYVGDNYLDKQWQKDILKRRVTFRKGIYVPSEEDHLFSIIYHAIIQKEEISDTYVKVMEKIGNFSAAQARDRSFLRGKLDSFMDRFGYKMVQPHDETVGYFI